MSCSARRDESRPPQGLRLCWNLLYDNLGVSLQKIQGARHQATAEAQQNGQAGLSILVISTLRNEGPHVLEWLAHHRAAGVGHFLLYSNDCDDGTDAMLDRLAQMGLVTHVPLQPEPGKPVQWQALRAANKHPALTEADWAICLDSDEFINLRHPDEGLEGLIAALPEGCSALALRWRLFGNDGRLGFHQGPTTAAFTRAAPPDLALPLGHFFKTLFRPADFTKLGVHRPRQPRREGLIWADGSGQALPPGIGAHQGRINLFGLPPASDLVQLNHYSLRSAAAYMIKRDRGLPNHTARELGLGYWTERNFNTVEDLSIAPMGDATAEALRRLRADAVLARLEEEARAWHAARLEEMLQDEENIRLWWHLALSGGSTPPDPRFAAGQIARLTALQSRKEGGRG